VEIRQDADPDPVGSGFVMGGANGEMGPFDGAVSFDDPDSGLGAIVLTTSSMEDGSTWEAAVVRVRFAAPPETTVVQVFFTPGDPDESPVPFPRTVHHTQAVLRAALDALLAGPTAEEQAGGATSWFSSATAGMVLGVTLDDGDAIVDFGDLPSVIPNASTSAGSQMLLAQLDATAFQFPTVETVTYRLDGDCEAFSAWLQYGGCEPRTRP
jgi:hypothetical protein